MFAATSFFVAIKEEFLFRGIVQNLLTQRLGPSKAILSTSVAFTLSHVGVPEFTLWVFSQIFVASVILGTVYIYGGSIFVVVAIHAVYDAIFSFTPLIAQPLPQKSWLSAFACRVAACVVLGAVQQEGELRPCPGLVANFLLRHTREPLSRQFRKSLRTCHKNPAHA
jgi:membrane protease YdiL (CAAX protease family)